jgi:hypothetical protein
MILDQAGCRRHGLGLELAISRVRQQALNLTRILYTNGYASSRPESAKEISRGPAERSPGSQTGAPEGRWTRPLNAPAPLV